MSINSGRSPNDDTGRRAGPEAGRTSAADGMHGPLAAARCTGLGGGAAAGARTDGCDTCSLSPSSPGSSPLGRRIQRSNSAISRVWSLPAIWSKARTTVCRIHSSHSTKPPSPSPPSPPSPPVPSLPSPPLPPSPLPPSPSPPLPPPPSVSPPDRARTKRRFILVRNSLRLSAPLWSLSHARISWELEMRWARSACATSFCSSSTDHGALAACANCGTMCREASAASREARRASLRASCDSRPCATAGATPTH